MNFVGPCPKSKTKSNDIVPRLVFSIPEYAQYLAPIPFIYDPTTLYSALVQPMMPQMYALLRSSKASNRSWRVICPSLLACLWRTVALYLAPLRLWEKEGWDFSDHAGEEESPGG